MELKPITRQEQIVAGKDLEPITRMEKFLKQYGGGSGGGASVQSDLAQNDPTAPDYVKNRTHYESEEIVNEPLNITWDGNTEGLTEVCSDEVSPFYKVSDLVFSDEQIKKMKYTKYDTENDNNYGECYYSDEWEGMISSGFVTPDIVAGVGVNFVRKAGAQFFGAVYPEVGVYFIKEEYPEDDYLYYITSLTSPESFEQTKTVVHKLDKKWLPDDVGGGSGVLTVGMVNTSLSTEVYEMDKTFEEIAAAIEARQGVQLIYDFEKRYPSVFMLSDFTRQSYGGAITSVAFSKVLYLESGMVFEGWMIFSDGTIEHFRSDVT